MIADQGTVDRESGRYLGSSAIKLRIAEHHLAEFGVALNRLTPEVDWAHEDPPQPTLLDVYGHADACVVQLVGSFDAWACAAAWRLGFANPNTASFVNLSGAPPATVKPVTDLIRDNATFKRLLELRHLAAHRGIVGLRRVLTSDRPGELFIRTDDNEEVLPMLHELVDWCVPQLTALHRFADEAGWRSPEFENAPHRLWYPVSQG